MTCAQERRRRRYARTQANMKAVNDVVELERISQELNEHSRAKGRVLEALQYENTSFHRDVNTQSRFEWIYGCLGAELDSAI